MGDKITIDTTMAKEEPPNKSEGDEVLNSAKIRYEILYFNTLKVVQMDSFEEFEIDVEETDSSDYCIANNIKDEIDIGPEIIQKQHYILQKPTEPNIDCNETDICDYTHVNTNVYTHADDKISCNICYKKLKNNKTAREHMRNVHEKYRCIPCYKCNKVFSCKSKLVRHMTIHFKIKPFQCDICFKIFEHKEYLTKHFKEHLSEKPYACKQRHKQFSSKTTLHKHQSDHEDKFECDICKKKFVRKHHLNLHVSLHDWKNQKQTYLCDVCHTGFISDKTFENHNCVKTKDD